MDNQDDKNMRGYFSPLTCSPLLLGLLLGAAGLPVAANDAGKVAPMQVAALTIWGQAPTEDTDAYIANRTTVGSKLPVSPRDIPQSVSVITRQRIEDQNLTGLEDALRWVPGVTVIPNDTLQSQYWARGYGLNISIDGVPSSNGLSGAEQFDLGIYDRVEVLRGPAGVLQGSGDLGGTVNVVTKKPRSEFGINAALSTGSWSNHRGELDITGPLNASGTLRGRLVGIGQDREFFYDRTEQRKWVGYGVLEFDVTNDLTLSLTHVSQDNATDVPFYGLPVSAPGGAAGQLLDVPRSTNPNPDWSYNDTRTRETVLAAEQRFANQWSLTAKWRHLTSDSAYKDAVPAGTGVDLSDHTFSYFRLRDVDHDYRRQAIDLYASGPFQLLGRKHQVLLGYNSETYRNQYSRRWLNQSITGVDLFNPVVPEPDLEHNQGSESETEQSGFYAQVRLQLLDPLTLVLGGRLSDYEERNRNRAPSTPGDWNVTHEESGEFTPYAGLVYDLTSAVTLYGSYADIFVPQRASWYSKADGSGLEPRVGKQFELGTKAGFFNDQLVASLALFRIRDENRPMLDPNHPPEDDYYVPSGEVESRGWELEVVGRPLPGWDLSAGYTRLKTRYVSDDDYAGQFSHASPKHSFKLWSHYRFQAARFSGLALGGGVTATSGYGSDRFVSDRWQGGYGLVSAVVSYAVNEQLSLALNGENLIDRKYYASLGNNTYNTYGDPRNFTLSLSYSY